MVLSSPAYDWVYDKRNELYYLVLSSALVFRIQSWNSFDSAAGKLKYYKITKVGKFKQ